MRRLGLSALLLASVACMQTPAAAPDGTTVTVTQDPSLMSGPYASAPPPPSASSPPPTSSGAATTSAEPAPSTLEDAVHLEVKPIADRCYSNRLAADSQVGEGMVTIRVIVHGTGPADASDLGSTLQDKKTISCVIAAFSHLTWHPADGKDVDSTEPFSFIKGSD
jgi:hypothetical protein